MLFPEDLWGHVSVSPHCTASPSESWRTLVTGKACAQSKINQNNHLVLLIHHNVGRLNVAVHEALECLKVSAEKSDLEL